MADNEPLDLAACRADINRAHTEVGDIAHDGAHRRWRMSIPARPDRDSDLLISTGLARGERLAEEVARLRAALGRAETAIASVRADCATIAAQREPGADLDHQTWLEGSRAQATRVLNILKAAGLDGGQ